MTKNVVILPKQAFQSSEPIEIHVLETATGKRVGIFVAPLAISKKPMEWKLIEVVAPGTHFTYSKPLNPGLYAIGTDLKGKIELCTIIKITDSSLGILGSSSIFATTGLVSCICLVKSIFLKGFRR